MYKMYLFVVHFIIRINIVNTFCS